jgi:diguanylate cyclase (GGDEF)-like protein
MNIVIDREKIKHLNIEKNIDREHTILVVDDELANIESLTMILEEKYNIIKAQNALEALTIIKNETNPEKINLIIADQRMPDMMGVEFLKQTMPIIPDAMRIILTGFMEVNDIIDSINEGKIYKFLTKPIEPNDLLITVKRALEAYELQIQNKSLIEKLQYMNENLEKKVEERTIQLQESIENLKKQKEDLEYLFSFQKKLVGELQLLSSTDPLTGIANRRKMEEFINIEWKRAIRENKEISFIMMDIDFFKLYNDYYGHCMGDSCLTRIAKIIAQEVKRPADIAARYGGEEFCCVLADTGLDGAIKIARNICRAIQRAAIPHENSPISPYVTLTYGVKSVLPDLDASWQDLLEGADKLLYQGKNNGRNCIYSVKGKANC